jgi:hypothetical protein
MDLDCFTDPSDPWRNLSFFIIDQIFLRDFFQGPFPLELFLKCHMAANASYFACFPICCCLKPVTDWTYH